MKVFIDIVNQAIVKTIDGKIFEVVKIDFVEQMVWVKVDVSDDGDESSFDKRRFTFDEIESIEFI